MTISPPDRASAAVLVNMSIKEAQTLVSVALARFAAATLAPDQISARLRLGRALIAAAAVDQCGHRWARARVAAATVDVRSIFASRGWL